MTSMNEAEYDEWTARLYRRLEVVVDDRWSVSIRLAAARAIQAQLAPKNPLRYLSPDSLLIQLARGHLRLQQLTQQRFVTD